MRSVITAAQAAEIDSLAREAVETLMERAGLAVAIKAGAMGAGYGRNVIVLCGPGNNGGDGYVAARYLLSRGASVRALALAEPRSQAGKWAAHLARSAGVEIQPWREPGPADSDALIVDALFGAGFRGELPDAVHPWVEAGSATLAVDMASGLDASTGLAPDPSFRAHATVTFHALKVGHLIQEGPRLSGDVEVADIGLAGGAAEFLVCDESDAPRPMRVRDAHKWSAGSVLVIGGSPGLGGAPGLAALTALRAGAGAVMIAVPGGLSTFVDRPELMTARVGDSVRFAPEDAVEILEIAERFDVLAVGPGLGPDQTGIVETILDRCNKPVILDADGINAMTELDVLTRRRASTILTPHAGEFRRLTTVDASYLSAASLAQQTGAVVLLKGAPTFVAGEELWAVTSGGPELATVGTGDVLTGFVAALIARGLPPEVAARSGAYWHGVAGRKLGSRGTVTADLLASEVRAWAG